MANRPNLQTFLMEYVGSSNVYLQPPSSRRMEYPAVRCSLNSIENEHADNVVYKQSRSYKITVIDKDPESKIADKISKLPMCSFDRFYVADNLNHFVFTLFY